MGRYMWIVLLVLLVQIANAQDLSCQYTVNETYSEIEKALVLENTLIKKGDILQISDFSEGEQSTFTVHNPNDYEMFAIFTYNVSGHNAGPKEKGLKLAERNYTLFKHYCYDGSTLGNCSIQQESVEYKVVKPEILEIREANITKTRPACKICGNSICLNDGISCNPLFDDEKCGSRICNIAGFCGHEKIVSCPEGKTNCDNECLLSKTKTSGEPYKCEWECGNGTVGINGVCEKDSETLAREEISRVKRIRQERTATIISTTILSILAIILIYWYLKSKIFPLIQIKSELEKQIYRLITEKKDIDSNLQYFKKRINEEREVFETQSNKLKQEISTSIGKAKEEFESEFNYLRSQNESRLQLLADEQKKLELLKSELEDNKRILEEENHKVLIQREIEKAKTIYHGRIKYENGYLRFTDSGKLLHIYLYATNIQSIPQNYEVHHIDRNSLNNELWNLIALPKEKHNSIYPGHLVHAKIEFRNWKSGIKQLREQLGLKNKDFHKFILDHLKKSKK